MQSAGRILLMPKGDYSADTTYTMLDLVNHNEASWVCKKDCTGQEPSDSNTEYWQRFGTAVDLANYATMDLLAFLTNNTKVLGSATSLAGLDEYYGVNGAVNVDISGNYQTCIVLSGGKWWNLQFLTMKYSNTPIKYRFSYYNNSTGSIAWDDWKEYFTTSGGKLARNSIATLELQNTGASDSLVNFSNSTGQLGLLGFRAKNQPIFYESGLSNWRELLHTGNKPSGSYTGNGSATSRTITTNGIGSVIMVKNLSTHDFAIVTSEGYIAKQGNTVVVGTDAYVYNSNLVVTTTSSLFNTSGTSYEYKVL